MRTRFLSQTEVDRLRKAMKPHCWALCWLMSETGLRISDALALKWEDYDEQLQEFAYTAKKTGVHFDKSYLTARFRDSLGTSPMRYVNHMRMERAKSLLATTDDSITQVAKAVGFSSIHYFSRYFKEKEGITPIEYREQRQSSVKPPNY